MLNQYTRTDTMKITDSRLRAVGASALFLFFYISLANAGIVFGQNVKYTQGNADSALQSSLEVNPSTLGMSIQVPLASYPGRGGGLPVVLRYSSKQWRIGFSDTFRQGTVTKTRTEGNWSENSTAGWTSSLTLPVIDVPPDYRGPYNGFGRPICSDFCDPPLSPSEPIRYINRVLLRMPDGSSHELRKDDATTSNSNADSGVYYAADSSNIRFETATNTVFMPDGSRYLLSVSAGTQAQYIDRHGNTLTYTFSSNQWTDALGRNIAFPLSNSSWGDVTNTRVWTKLI